MMHGPHPPGVDAGLMDLPDDLRIAIDVGLRRCDGGPDNYRIGVLLLLTIGPVKFAEIQTMMRRV